MAVLLWVLHATLLRVARAEIALGSKGKVSKGKPVKPTHTTAAKPTSEHIPEILGSALSSSVRGTPFLWLSQFRMHESLAGALIAALESGHHRQVQDEPNHGIHR